MPGCFAIWKNAINVGFDAIIRSFKAIIVGFDAIIVIFDTIIQILMQLLEKLGLSPSPNGESFAFFLLYSFNEVKLLKNKRNYG